MYGAPKGTLFNDHYLASHKYYLLENKYYLHMFNK